MLFVSRQRFRFLPSAHQGTINLAEEVWGKGGGLMGMTIRVVAGKGGLLRGIYALKSEGHMPLIRTCV